VVITNIFVDPALWRGQCYQHFAPAKTGKGSSSHNRRLVYPALNFETLIFAAARMVRTREDQIVCTAIAYD